VAAPPSKEKRKKKRKKRQIKKEKEKIGKVGGRENWKGGRKRRSAIGTRLKRQKIENHKLTL